jgi:hypothetical protein
MGKKPPKAPDPIQTSAAQAGQNVMAANANTVAGSGTVTTPYGTRSSVLDYVDVINPLTGKYESVARPNVTETLAPGQRAIFDENQASETNLAKYGNQQTTELLKRGGTPFSYDTGEYEKWFGKNYDALNSETNEQNDESLRSRLSNQGIKMGGEAYNREVANYAKGRDLARLEAMLGSQQQGFQQALAIRNQQTNEPLAIASGTQISMPQFSGGPAGNVATVDHSGNVQNAFMNDMERWRAKQAGTSALFTGLGNAAMAFSEPGMKKNKVKLPMKTKDGIQMWTYNYKGEPAGTPKHTGVMADETQRKKPSAVVKTASGKRMVDYGIVMGA